MKVISLLNRFFEHFVARCTVRNEESVINYHLVDYCYKNIFKELTTKLKYGNFPSILYKIYQILQLEGGLLKIDWMDCKPAL